MLWMGRAGRKVFVRRGTSEYLRKERTTGRRRRDGDGWQRIGNGRSGCIRFPGREKFGIVLSGDSGYNDFKEKLKCE